MDATAYELLIRQANECGRMDVDGADANVYRVYEAAAMAYSAALNGAGKPGGPSNEALAYDAGFKTGIVVAYVKAAIYKVLKENNNLDDDQYTDLEKNLSQLVKPSKSVIDTVIKSSGNIFRAIGLRAR
ncbi:MAG: hypothetical protein JWQ38_3805 [Flavipsychrobacter sp.]|nr:hypothetical protein [Flavipsychrobacter sp.]